MSHSYQLFGDVAHCCMKLSTHYTVGSHEEAGTVAMARVLFDANQAGQPFFYRLSGNRTIEGVVVAGPNGWFLVHNLLGNNPELEFKWSSNYATAERTFRDPQLPWILKMMILHSLPMRDVVRMLELSAREPEYTHPEWSRDGWRNAIVAALKILEPEAVF